MSYSSSPGLEDSVLYFSRIWPAFWKACAMQSATKLKPMPKMRYSGK